MSIDGLFMEFVHALCVYAGFIFTPLLRFISIIGEKAWIFILISFLLLLSKKTRWVGATALLSILLGFILSNIIVKPMIGRVRPYLDNMLFQDYWKLAGAIPETNFSMPSGHTLACAAFFISLYITAKKNMKKRIFIAGVICVLLMIVSRTYFMHHYLTDCLVGIVFAVISSIAAKLLIKLFYKFCKSYEDIGIFNFIINFDLYNRNNNA